MTEILTAKKILRRVSFILLFVVILGYGLWQARDLLFGIRLSVEGISNGASYDGTILPIHGTAHHAIGITINGRGISVSEDGSWKDTIALVAGYNTIDISATDKFKKTITKEFIVYSKKPKEPEVAPPAPEQEPKTPPNG